MKSQNTTWAGIVTILGMILVAVGYTFDGNPDTTADTAGIVEVIGLLLSGGGAAAGNILSRDANK